MKNSDISLTADALRDFVSNFICLRSFTITFLLFFLMGLAFFMLSLNRLISYTSHWMIFPDYGWLSPHPSETSVSGLCEWLRHIIWFSVCSKASHPYGLMKLSTFKNMKQSAFYSISLSLIILLCQGIHSPWIKKKMLSSLKLEVFFNWDFMLSTKTSCKVL